MAEAEVGQEGSGAGGLQAFKRFSLLLSKTSQALPLQGLQASPPHTFRSTTPMLKSQPPPRASEGE